MKRWALMGAAVIVLALGWLARSRARAVPLRLGDRAPDFALPDQSGIIVRLSDFRGRKAVVLAFYIKAFTPG